MKRTVKGKILILDDDESILKLLTAMLKIVEYSTKLTKDGKEFMEAFSESLSNEQPYSALILDLSLPDGRGGKELISEIRQLDSKIPVFVSSGHAGDPIILKPQEFGFNAAIIKPFTLAELKNILDLNLKG